MNRRMFGVVSLVMGGLTVAGSAIAGPDWSLLPMSNGHSAAVYDVEQRKLTAFYEHPYKFPAPGSESADLCFDSYPGIAIDGKGVWLNTVPTEIGEEGAGYLLGTGIVRTKQLVGELVVETTVFSPMSAQEKLVVMAVTVTHGGQTPRNVSVFSLHNYHVGTGSPIPSNQNERIVWTGAGYVETALESARTVTYLPVGGVTVHGASPENPYPLITGGQLAQVEDSGVTNDAVCGFQKDFGMMQPGDQHTFAVVTALSGDGVTGETLLAASAAWVAGRTAEQLIQAEKDEWATWQNKAAVPALGSEVLYRQSLVVLRMAQVREPNVGATRPYGQILASLPPGQWAISWPRDAAYSIAALATAGYWDEARAGLEFMLTAQSGGYAAYLNNVPYLISVCRYYGHGIEESDGDPNTVGPNIELDDFGLFLWALGIYVEQSGDIGFFSKYFPDVRDLIAGALVSLIEPGLDIVVKDSSIWERHWNGNEKHFTFSTLTAIRGLCETSRWSEQIGESGVAAEFREAARTLHAGMLAHLTDESLALVGNLEEKAGGLYADAAVVEAINLGVIPGNDPVALHTLALIEERLKLPSGGYKRNDDGDWYDEQEWVFIDMRMKKARKKAGLPPKNELALAIVKAVANHGLFAELYTAGGAYEGAVPMVGYGAGVYVLDVLENEPVDVLVDCLKGEVSLPEDSDVGDTVDGGGSPVDTVEGVNDTEVDDVGGDAVAQVADTQAEISERADVPDVMVVDGVGLTDAGSIGVDTGTVGGSQSDDGCKITVDNTRFTTLFPRAWLLFLSMVLAVRARTARLR